MKKITLLIAAFILSIGLYAQEQSISFEEDEGYFVGEEVGGVDGWVQSEPFYTITDEEASEGEQSLKLGEEELGTSLGLAILDAPMSEGQYKVSAKFKFTSLLFGAGQLHFMVATVGDDGLDDLGRLVAFEGEGGSIGAEIEETSDGSTVTTYSEVLDIDGWNDLVIYVDYEAGTLTYEVNDIVIPDSNSQEEAWTDDLNTAIEAVVIATSGDNDIYVDEVSVEDISEMGVEDHNFDSFTHYINNNELVLDAVSNQIDGVAIYNLLGQEVVNENINATSGSIDLNALSAGVYVTKVTIDGQTKTFKFSKN